MSAKKRKSAKKRRKYKRIFLDTFCLMMIVLILLGMSFFLKMRGLDSLQIGGDDVSFTEIQTATSSPPAYTEIRITGGTVFCADGEVSLQEAVSYAKSNGTDTVVKIVDDGAVQNTIDELTKALEREKISYAIGE